MENKKQKKAAGHFAGMWKGKGDEKRDCQKFWIQLLQEVYGVEHPYKIIDFEVPVKVKHIGFIDCYIHGTKVLIEQKSLGIDLGKAAKQSDGAMLTPYEQAKRYADNVPYSIKPRYIITCNFSEFWVYDMERIHEKPEKIKLEELPDDYHLLQFLADSDEELRQREEDISVKAGEIVGQLYDAFAKQYANLNSVESLHSLNVLCVRLVFCLYAEKSGLFGKHNMFHDYLNNFPHNRKNKALAELFEVLDQKPEERSPYVREDPMLSAFPYVNGGLFAEKGLYIPIFNDDIYKLLFQKAHRFDWSQISPTIFGAVFESTLNPETRRSGGMHYTSVLNIHKVIVPLFLEALWMEFKNLRTIAEEKTRNRLLLGFQAKLASLRFLDPACGSGNFLTETYLSLRKLENEILKILSQGQSQLAWEEFNPIKVSLSQFHGIEINEFAVSVAKTALWIAESQMMAETEKIVRMQLDFLPLKTSANIVRGNALRLDWESIVPRSQLSYIMGNPPFVGARLMSKEQKQDLFDILQGWQDAGNLDYVAGWYYKAAQMMQGTNIRTALVSTNSITQGEQVATLWKPLFSDFGVHFDFARRTFRWDSEASLKAHVHCVIVGFSTAPNNKPKIIYDGDRMQEASNINGYLVDAPNIFITSRSKPLCDVPVMSLGNQPIDGGHYSFTKEQKDEFIKKEPASEKYFRPFVGSKEFINRIPRYFLYLRECSPAELRSMTECMKVVDAVRQFRLASNREVTRRLADTPREFAFTNISTGTFIVVPEVSSERRRYIPMGFMTPETLCSNLVKVIANATLYHFGVLTSNVHNGWMRAVCGRLKSDYRYSNTIVYNNFPWPEPTEEQKAKIEETAKAILDARALYPDSSLADLYDETAMPPELRTAHQRNDSNVCAAYGWTANSPEFSSESACVATLMKMYQRLTATKSDN